MLNSVESPGKISKRFMISVPNIQVRKAYHFYVFNIAFVSFF